MISISSCDWVSFGADVSEETLGTQGFSRAGWVNRWVILTERRDHAPPDPPTWERFPPQQTHRQALQLSHSPNHSLRENLVGCHWSNVHHQPDLFSFSYLLPSIGSSPPDLTPLTALSQCHKTDWWLKQPILCCKSSFETWWNDWRGFISSVDEKESLCTGAKAFKWRFGRWLNKLEWWQQCLEQLTFESRLLNSTNVDFLEGSVATLIINIILFALSLLSYHSSTTTLGFKLLLWAAFSSGLFQDLLSNKVKGNQAASFVFYQLDQFTIPSSTDERDEKCDRP